ncbi:DUF4349 domain-containing protein [Cytobacillus sp. FJAT-54145]|uniref:DUF4349 domain-containing protein n=1 Tax=Cytobacillus spartinae TaxID=3299023 RepID=A0ABW6KJH2_9BACI
MKLTLRNVALLFALLLIFLLSACSSGDSKTSEQESTSADMDTSVSNSSNEEAGLAFSEGESVDADKTKTVVTSNRMVIYNAHLNLQVEDFEKAQRQIEEKASFFGGYIVESSTYREGDERLSGTITLRIPEEHFQTFLNEAEGLAVKVFDRSVSGEDVTEEYVDLESRLKSKRVVEERLLDFMKNATKTEDLLRISNDLAVVQQEIEQITGKMKYIKNQTALSTVTIHLSEDKIVVPSLQNHDLNTWERTKKQFASSTNLLLNVFSSLVVVILGNIPILLLLSIIVTAVVVVVKKTNQLKKPRE